MLIIWNSQPSNPFLPAKVILPFHPFIIHLQTDPLIGNNARFLLYLFIYYLRKERPNNFATKAGVHTQLARQKPFVCTRDLLIYGQDSCTSKEAVKVYV